MNALYPGMVSYIVANIANKAGCDGLCEEVKKRIDKLDILSVVYLAARMEAEGLPVSTTAA
jgi:hypothetical protein